MAVVNIDYSCGCGVHARTVEEAIAHADDRMHVVNVFGVIRPSGHKVSKTAVRALANPRPSRPVRAAAPPPQAPEESKVDFGNLRAQLRRR